MFVLWGGFILLVGIYFYFLVLDAEGCTTCLIRSRNPLINRGYYFTNKYIPAEDFNIGTRKAKLAYKFAVTDSEFRNDIEVKENEKDKGQTEITSEFYAYPSMYKVTYHLNYGFLYGGYVCTCYVNVVSGEVLVKNCTGYYSSK